MENWFKILKMNDALKIHLILVYLDGFKSSKYNLGAKIKVCYKNKALKVFVLISEI